MTTPAKDRLGEIVNELASQIECYFSSADVVCPEKHSSIDIRAALESVAREAAEIATGTAWVVSGCTPEQVEAVAERIADAILRRFGLEEP